MKVISRVDYLKVKANLSTMSIIKYLRVNIMMGRGKDQVVSLTPKQVISLRDTGLEIKEKVKEN